LSRRIPAPPGADPFDHRHFGVGECTSRRNGVESRYIRAHGVKFETPPRGASAIRQVICDPESTRINNSPVQFEEKAVAA